MDCSDNPSSVGRPSPRRELQGPRPPPLKVRKDSHKVKKPPIAPQHPPHRPPVIIYTVSPKIIHTHPSEFKSLVQRLTGGSSSSVVQQSVAGSMSPAAKLATIEKSRQEKIGNDVLDRLGIDQTTFGATSSERAGILSPVPASLPMISPNFFFSPPAAVATNPLTLLHDSSPFSFGHSKSYADNSFLVSPSNLLSAQVAPSPIGYYWDLFNQYQEP